MLDFSTCIVNSSSPPMLLLRTLRTLVLTLSMLAKCSGARVELNTEEGDGESWIQIDPTTDEGSFCQKRGRLNDATPSMR